MTAGVTPVVENTGPPDRRERRDREFAEFPARRGRRPRELRAYRTWALAQAIRGGVRDIAFRDLVQRIDGGEMHFAPPVRLMVDGAETFDAVHAAIAEATEEILVETYILRDDRIGASLRSALAAAVRRNVRVCVLADAVGSVTTHDQFWKALASDGVTVRLFNRLRSSPTQALRRDHRKIIVVDRNVAFTGGMNIAEEYGSSIRAHENAWRDTFIRVEGSVARELAAVFAEGWDRAGGMALPGLEYVSWNAGIVRESDIIRFAPAALRDRMERALRARHDRRRGRRVRRERGTASDAEERSMIVLDPRPGRAQREMLAIMAALVGGARERLWVTTPYFAPPTRALSLIGKAARQGIDVRLMLPGKSDVPIMRHAAHGAYEELLEQGVRIFEYDAAVLHAKTLVVDGYAGVVGSSNLDFRSFWLNAECNLLLFDTGCGGALEKAFVDDMKGAHEITLAEWRKRPFWHRVMDAGARSLRLAL